MTRYTYLLIDLGTLLLPFLFSFHPRLRFYREWQYFFPACAIAGFAFVLWDIQYTALGVWSFNPDYVTGIRIVGLPLEEWLFFLCIPYACVFTYHCLGLLLDIPERTRLANVIAFLLVATLMCVAVLNSGKLYTAVTFFGLGVTIGLLQWIARVAWMQQFFISYGILLLPFFVVNGLLTGTGLAAAIVQYNDVENLGIRLLTIPAEDIFYGMLLILLNVALMEFFRMRATVRGTSNGINQPDGNL